MKQFEEISVSVSDVSFIFVCFLFLHGENCQDALVRVLVHPSEARPIRQRCRAEVAFGRRPEAGSNDDVTSPSPGSISCYQ